MDARLKKQVRAKKALLTKSLTELDTLVIEGKHREEVKVYIDSVKQKKQHSLRVMRSFWLK